MPIRPLFETLRDVRGGELIDDMAKALQELTHAVSSTGGAGRLTLVLDIKPMKGATEAVVVVDEIKLKVPEHKRHGTVMFPTVEGNLQRSNPAQRDLPGISIAADSAGTVTTTKAAA